MGPNGVPGKPAPSFAADTGDRPSGNRGRKIKKSQLAKGGSESKAKRVGRSPLAGEAPQQSGRGVTPRKKSGKRCAVHSVGPCCQKDSCPRAGTKRGESRQVGRGYLPLGNTRQTAAHSKPRRQNHKKGGRELLRPLPARICTIKRSPTKTSAQKTERTRQARRAIGGQAQPARETLANRTPAGCRSADPQKVGGAPRPSRGRLRPSGQCEHVLHAREKKQAYGLVPAEGKKQVGTKRTLSWRRKPLASRIAAGCHRKESPHKVGSAAEALWARLRTAVASAALFGKEERRRTPTTFLREKSPQTAEGPRRCRRC